MRKSTSQAEGKDLLGLRIQLNRFPVCLCKVIGKLCKNWTTRVVVTTSKGRET